MILSSTVINNSDSLDQIKWSLICLFDFDDDWNGNNGNSYLLPDASGYESNNEYFIETQSTIPLPINKDSLSDLIDSYFELNRNYRYVCDIHEKDEFLLISLAVIDLC